MKKTLKLFNKMCHLKTFKHIKIIPKLNKIMRLLLLIKTLENLNKEKKSQERVIKEF